VRMRGYKGRVINTLSRIVTTDLKKAALMLRIFIEPKCSNSTLSVVVTRKEHVPCSARQSRECTDVNGVGCTCSTLSVVLKRNQHVPCSARQNREFAPRHGVRCTCSTLSVVLKRNQHVPCPARQNAANESTVTDFRRYVT
jgi:hypothetical protein